MKDLPQLRALLAMSIAEVEQHLLRARWLQLQKQLAWRAENGNRTAKREALLALQRFQGPIEAAMASMANSFRTTIARPSPPAPAREAKP
jgi:hypothetical protein